MQKCRHLWLLSLTLASASSSAALASGPDGYAQAFGPESPEAASTDTVEPTDSEAAIDSLREVGSFPVRVRRGDGDTLGWTNVARRNYIPKPAVRLFKAGKCEFRVTTGDLGLTRYEFREDTHEVAVDTDPILRFSTLEVSATQGLLVSVNAELFAAPLDGYETSCRDKFLGRTVAFGRADMGLTELVLERDGAVDMTTNLKAEPYLPQTETPVFITWNAKANRMELVRNDGVLAAVTSPVFLVKPRAAGDYYVRVSPKIGIERPKKR